MEITTDNLFDSGHIMTHQEYIWAGITVGVGSDRISRFVESALDIASGNYSGTVQEKHAEANRILDYLGIDKQDMFEIFGHSSPIDAVDAIGEDWLQGFNDNINSVIKDVRVHGKPSNLFYDLANKTLTGDVERDPSDIYPILGATFTEDKVLLDAFRSHNWNFSQKEEGYKITFQMFYAIRIFHLMAVRSITTQVKMINGKNLQITVDLLLERYSTRHVLQEIES